MGGGGSVREGRPLKADADRADTCTIVLSLRRGTELPQWSRYCIVELILPSTDVALMCIWIRNTVVISKYVYFFYFHFDLKH